FRTHHIFAFLIFNIGVRLRNCRVSILSIKRKNFLRVKHIIHLLSLKRLEITRVKLEILEKTINKEINKLL
ncbi:hypothetical protein K469DRAFT_583657, partial [Zopfia rhizophila CBS 207.26]